MAFSIIAFTRFMRLIELYGESYTYHNLALLNDLINIVKIMTIGDIIIFVIGSMVPLILCGIVIIEFVIDLVSKFRFPKVLKIQPFKNIGKNKR